MANRYDVTVPRKYRDAAGNERTHFWLVGTGFGFEARGDEGAEGVSVKLYSKMIVTDQFVLFKREPESQQNEPPPDDGMPF